MEKINFYTQYSLNDTPELRMVIDVSGNVGIGESNPTKALEVAGDISFNGDLYQNGTLFVGGGGGLTDLSATSINDLSDVSLNGIQLNQTLKWDGEKLVPYTPGTTATSITKQGQVLETLAGVCDGRTVTVESGSYTLPNVTAYQDTTTSWTDVAGSSINYTPPSGTKQVIFEFHLSLSSNTDSKAIMLFKLLIDGISVTSQNQEWGDDTNTYGDNIFYRSIIDITGTNDVANGKLESWNSNKTIKLQVVNFSGFDGRLHANYFGGLSSNSSATHNLIKPRLKITSIGESSGQAVTLTNNSVSDLSDISFNSTSTTDGQALVWNSTDGVWEAAGAGNVELGSTGTGIVRITDNLALNGNVEIFNDSSDMVKINDSLLVTGDISFNGNLYQNGTLFQSGSGGGGSTIDETTDVSLNNLMVHGDLSANDASFNNVDISNVLNVNSQITIGDEIESSIDFTTSTQTKIVASDAAETDYFGESVAVDGNYAIVGTERKGSHRGNAYIFNTSTGTQLHKLSASDGYNSDKFGHSVAISGNYAIVGAYGNSDDGYQSGSAYIFNVTTGVEIHKLTASDASANDRFGWFVGIDGDYAIVGAPQHDNIDSNIGSAYIFNVTTGQQLQKLTSSDAAADDQFGYSVAISGNYAIVGAWLDDDGGAVSGSAYIFNVTTGQQLQKLTANDAAVADKFGESVAISGNYAIVGTRYDDDGGNESGSAYIFNVTTGEQLHKLTASDAYANDYFGFSVAISGNYAIVGAYQDDDNGTDSGSAYIFNVTTGEQLHKLTANDGGASDRFGWSVGISGIYAITGATLNDDESIGIFSNTGSAYIFTGTLNSPDANTLIVNGDGLFSGSVTANGSVLSSDDRIKHNEQPITNALSTISKITPKHYFKTGSTLYDTDHHFPLNDQNQPISASGTPLLLNKDYTIETGIIAQEIKAIPELSFTVQNTTPLGVDYNSIHCTHIAATKELHQLVQSQQTQIEEQQSEIEHLKMVNIDMNNQLAYCSTTTRTYQTLFSNLAI
jgi:esterase/lipase superfamily enzyme